MIDLTFGNLMFFCVGLSAGTIIGVVGALVSILGI